MEEKKNMNEGSLLTKRDLMAIEIGDSDYLTNIGAEYYSKGEYDKARIYYELAASLGSSTAISNLGYVYMYGREVPVDYTVALAFYSIGAKSGNIDCLYKLGNLYQNGNGVEKDVTKALTYYQTAVDFINRSGIEGLKLEYPSVFFTLAKEMMPGGLIESDLSEAFSYLATACAGYDYSINELNATYYRKAFEDAKALLADPMFDEYRIEDDGEDDDYFDEYEDMELLYVEEDNKPHKNSKGEYLYVKVNFFDSPIDYSYISNYYEIEIGDTVIVDAAGNEVNGEVVDKKYYKESEVPYPLDKTKLVNRVYREVA